MRLAPLHVKRIVLPRRYARLVVFHHHDSRTRDSIHCDRSRRIRLRQPVPQCQIEAVPGVSGGSEILVGSIADTVTGTLNRQLTRTFDFGINSGYARNTALGIPDFGIAAQSYDYWFAGANIRHPWSRTLSLFASYQLQYQTSNVGFCLGATCGTSYVGHLISVGVNWRSRPMLF